MAVSRMRSEKYAIKRSFMAESPKFTHPIRNQGRGTRWWRQILNRKWKYGRYITLIYGGMSEILASYRKSRSRNMMVTEDFRPKVEICPFRACAVKKYAIKRSFMAESPTLPHHTVMRECCKDDDQCQWERLKFDPPPHLNPLADRHQNLPTWLRRWYLPSRKSTSTSNTGFRFCACAISRIKLFTRLFFRFFGVFYLVYSQDARTDFNEKYVRRRGSA